MSEPKIKRQGAKDVIVRKLGVLGVVGMFYSMCCAGAYGIEEMIPEGGPGLTLILLLVLPFVWGLPYCFICSELSALRPEEGGSLIWVKEALGQFWFGIIVIVYTLWSLIANTVYVVLAVSYLQAQFPMINDIQAYIIKVALVIIFFIINVLGLKEVSMVNTIISVAVFVMFAIVAVIGFANIQYNPFEPMINPDYSDFPVMAFGATLGLGLWMYSGFDQIALVAGEVKNASRVIPRALMVVVPLIVLTYVLPTAAGLGSLGNWADWTTEADGLSYHSVMYLSPVAPYLLSLTFVVVAILAQCSIYNICIVTASRSIMILADENFGPSVLARLSSKRGMPIIALVIVSVFSILLLGTPGNQLEFTFLVLVEVFFTVVACVLTAISGSIIRRKAKANNEKFTFKIPGGQTGHNVYVALVLIFSVAFTLLNGTDYYLGGMIIMIIIPVLYVIAKLVWKGPTAKEPELYPIDRRTRLGFGDVSKLGGFYLGLGLYSILIRFWLNWYERDMLTGYFTTPDIIEDWEQEIIDTFNADFPNVVLPVSDGEIYVPGWYETVYGSGLFANFDSMLAAIMLLGIITAFVGAVLLVAGRRLKMTESRVVSQ